jgi:hypothetical protein
VDREFSDRMLRYEVKIILKDSRPKRDEQKSEQVVSFNVNQIRDRKLLHENLHNWKTSREPSARPPKTVRTPGNHIKP